ncbi:MAG: hypothetical protein BWY40_00715 [bacterium ADurb.Bin270]|nr:MAG: hypothetical protein BWY40_00715 [bacterium ADurb.Bin270]
MVGAGETLVQTFKPIEQVAAENGITMDELETTPATKAAVGPYTVNYTEEERIFGVVAEGPYKGEVIGPCNQGSEGMLLSDVYLSADEAKAIRDTAGIERNILFLDMDSTKEGMYCVKSSHAKHVAATMDCNDLEESIMPDFIEHFYGITRYLPVPGNSRCAKIMDSLAPSMLVEGVKIGSGFVVAGIAGERIVKLITGRSLIKGPAKKVVQESPSPPVNASGRPIVHTVEKGAKRTSKLARRRIHKGFRRAASKVPGSLKIVALVAVGAGIVVFSSEKAKASPKPGHFVPLEEIRRPTNFYDIGNGKVSLYDTCKASTGCYFLNWMMSGLDWYFAQTSSEAH